MQTSQMRTESLKTLISDLLASAGVCVGGQNPWDIQIHNEQFYSRVLHAPSVGLGESYMDKWWDCQRLDLFFERVFSAGLEYKVKENWLTLIKLYLEGFINWQTKKRSLEVGRRHYDLGNELFEHMLDRNMNYSCGYWAKADNLEDAQLAKMELICQKLMLKPGMRVLDIGCGFGSLAKYAASQHGVKVTGVTISREQYEYAKNNCAGLPVEINFQDYRDVRGGFDRVVSVGMFEHVGSHNYLQYMQLVHKVLKPDGLFLLHTIGNNVSYNVGDEWINKYIFPNGMLPSIAQIGAASEGLFVMEDWHNFGAYYDRTLMAWHENFLRNWDSLKHLYDDRFYRMWNYYLLSCASIFRVRRTQLWQIVFSRDGMRGGYQAPR